MGPSWPRILSPRPTGGPDTPAPHHPRGPAADTIIRLLDDWPDTSTFFAPPSAASIGPAEPRRSPPSAAPPQHHAAAAPSPTLFYPATDDQRPNTEKPTSHPNPERQPDPRRPSGERSGLVGNLSLDLRNALTDQVRERMRASLLLRDWLAASDRYNFSLGHPRHTI